MYDDVETKVCDEMEAVQKVFGKERYYCGGPIPKHMLTDPKNVKLLKLELVDAIDIAHAVLDRTKMLAKTKYRRKIGQHIIPQIIHHCEGMNVKQDVLGGLLLLWLELVEGCDWRSLVNNEYKFKCAKAGSK